MTRTWRPPAGNGWPRAPRICRTRSVSTRRRIEKGRLADERRQMRRRDAESPRTEREFLASWCLGGGLCFPRNIHGLPSLALATSLRSADFYFAVFHFVRGVPVLSADAQPLSQF